MTIHVPAWLLWMLAGAGSVVGLALLAFLIYALLTLWAFIRGMK